jgi:hypothetical protein
MGAAACSHSTSVGTAESEFLMAALARRVQRAPINHGEVVASARSPSRQRMR